MMVKCLVKKVKWKNVSDTQAQAIVNDNEKYHSSVSYL